jgi:hypothetical protein
MLSNHVHNFKKNFLGTVYIVMWLGTDRIDWAGRRLAVHRLLSQAPRAGEQDEGALHKSMLVDTPVLVTIQSNCSIHAAENWQNYCVNGAAMLTLATAGHRGA